MPAQFHLWSKSTPHTPATRSNTDAAGMRISSPVSELFSNDIPQALLRLPFNGQ